MQRLHYLQHVAFEGLGCIRPWADAAGWRITGTRLFENARLPAIQDFDWLVIMGGPMNVHQDLEHPWLKEEKILIGQAIEQKKVVLGICLGAQLIADVLGARVTRNRHKEIGWHPVYRTAKPEKSSLLPALADNLPVLHWHADTFDLPAGAVHLARSEACQNQAFIYAKRVLGLQFHLEVSREGLQALVRNCADDITEGPFVQSAETMLADPERFDRANRTMETLLRELIELNP